MGVLPDGAKELIRSGALGHLVTVNRDGSPQVSVVWVGVEGDDLVTGHFFRQQKHRNVERDPRVVVTFEGPEATRVPGLRDHLIVHGRATIEEGGGRELLKQLSVAYVGPDNDFPPMADPPDGLRLRIAVERIGGIGPWAS